MVVDDAMSEISETSEAGDAAPTSRTRRKVDVKLLLASLGIAAGLVLVVLGVMSSVTGREQQGLPDEIESIDPIRGATQVPQQTRVFVDFIDGYTGVLVIDGTEVPTISLDELSPTPVGVGGEQDGDQIAVPDAAVFEPGNFTLSYVTREGGLVAPLRSGEHQATVIFWKLDEGRNRSLTFTWSFYVV